MFQWDIDFPLTSPLINKEETNKKKDVFNVAFYVFEVAESCCVYSL